MKVRLHSEAKAELVAGAEWYEKQKPGLAADFIGQVLRALDLISETPTVWPAWPETPSQLRIRRFIVSEFPYLIAYSSDDEVFVLAIAHAKRDPLYWLDRVR